MDTLYIVIPAYNEQDNIETVARDWHKIVEKLGRDSRLVVVDDGSRDSTAEILRALQKELHFLVVLTKENSGHGGALLWGYQYALEQGADYIFQTDSDGQTLSEEFWDMWPFRRRYDYQIGYRRYRRDGAERVVVTRVLRAVLLLFFSVWVTDANSPFRLMSAATLRQHLAYIPPDYHLTNVMLSVLYQRSGQRGRFPEITFLPRQGGVNSINRKRILAIGLRALRDFWAFRQSIPAMRRGDGRG